MRILDVRLVQDREGRWRIAIEGRRVPRAEGDRPSTTLVALAKRLDAAARARPEAEEAADPASTLFDGPSANGAPLPAAENIAAARALLDRVKRLGGAS